MGAASVDTVSRDTLTARPLAEDVAAGTARLTAVDLDSLTDADLLAVCELVRQSRRALESLHVRLTAQLDNTRASESELSTSAETYVMLSEQVTKREASAQILAARRARRWPSVDLALRTGAITLAHQQVIVHALERFKTRVDDDVLNQIQADLIVSSHDALPHAVRRWAQLRETELDARDAQAGAQALAQARARAHANRYLSFFRDGRGAVRIRGMMAEDVYEEFAPALESFLAQQTPPAAADMDDGGGVPRTRRQVDALLDMAVAAVASDRPSGARPRASLVVTVDFHRLLDLARAHGYSVDEDVFEFLRSADLGDDAALAAAAAGPASDHWHGQTLTGMQITIGHLRRLLCDARILPAVLGSAGQPLDIGRARSASATLRTAVMLRDRGCVFPNCTAPPTHCELHHVTPHVSGGATAIDNLCALCPRHHIEVQHAPGSVNQWTIEFSDDGVPTAVPPRALDARREPRINDRFKNVTLSPPRPGLPPASGAPVAREAHWMRSDPHQYVDDPEEPADPTYVRPYFPPEPPF